MGQKRPEPGVRRDINHRAEGAETFIFSSPDHQLQPGLATRGCAHRTRFEGNVEGAFRQAPISDLLTRLTENDHFSVRSWIAAYLAPITGPRDDLTLADDNGAHGDLAAGCRRLGFAQSLSHEAAVIVVEYPVRQHGSSITKGPRKPGPE